MAFLYLRWARRIYTLISLPLVPRKATDWENLKNISKHKVTGTTQYRFMKGTSSLTNTIGFCSENEIKNRLGKNGESSSCYLPLTSLWSVTSSQTNWRTGGLGSKLVKLPCSKGCDQWHKSHLQPVTTGAPQGLTVWPALFSVFINDLREHQRDRNRLEKQTNRNLKVQQCSAERALKVMVTEIWACETMEKCC